MAYAEQRGTTWRVKYMTPAGERSRSGFEKKEEALDWGREQEREIKRRRWRDPRLGEISVRDWIKEWTDQQDLAETTEENYGYMIRSHIQPRFGDDSLNDLDRGEVEKWEKSIRARGFAPSVAAKARSVFGTILEDAVDAGYIGRNPAAKKRKRGRQDIHAATTAESLWFNEHEVLEVAERVALISGRPEEFLQVVLGAYTGMRGAEMRGLERRYARLGEIRVEWQLREVDGVFIKAPPKHNSRRTIPLPPFLTSLMSEQLQRVKSTKCACHEGDYVFRAQAGAHQGRSHFANRYFRLATDGLPIPRKGRDRLPLLVNAEGGLVIRRGRVDRAWMEARAVASWQPILSGATPHDLRHSQKTWMIGDGIPQVAQYERLGHKLAGMDRIYSHVAPEFRTKILEGMQERWERSLKARARKGPSRVPVLQALLEPHQGPWKMISHIPPIGGAKIFSPQFTQVM